MNLPTIFNIAIGLIFIYLVLSLLASQVQEVFATLLEWRAEQLTRGIENLVLGDTDPESKVNNKKTYDLVDSLFKNPLVRNLNQTSKSWIATIPQKIISWLAKIPVIQALIPQNKGFNRNTINPAYLPAETFSSTILSELNIPKAARVLTWLNAKRMIHDEIYTKIDKLLESVDANQPESEKITQYQKDVIKQHYEELRKCLKSVLHDYKMERYGLSSTLIRLRTHIETFKKGTEEYFATKEISQDNGSDQAIKSIENPIDKITDFIFTPDKNDSDLVSRLRPSLTTILDLLIPPLDLTLPASQAIDFIFTHKGNNRDLDILFRSRLSDFLKLLMPAKNSKIKPHEDVKVNRFDLVIDFIFQNKYELSESYRENFSKILDCLILPDTCKSDKLNAYQIFKVALKNASAKSENADDLYKVFTEIEKHLTPPYLPLPLAYQSFQADLSAAKSDKEAKSDPETDDLYDSFTYTQKYFNDISSRLPESLRKSLYELAVRSRIKASDIEDQLNHFKQEIETWFDRSMDRASGVYKRNARGFTFLIGFILAFALNADTFYIVSRLSKDDALRNSIVSTSTQLVQNIQSSNPSPIDSQSSPAEPSTSPTLISSQNTIERVKNNVDQSLSDISLPIGWTDNILDEQLQRSAPDKVGETPGQKQSREALNKKRRVKIFDWEVPLELIRIMGWLVTATAIMMGAPFWFDFLGLFINVRNTGSRPASKTDKD